MTESNGTPDELYWHYTDASGLIGIVESGTLRASSTLFMNDMREISLGTERVKQWLDDPRIEVSEKVRQVVDGWLTYTEEARGRILHTFLFCAAKDGGDSLAMWRGYGQGTVGYAIGLHPEHQFMHKGNEIFTTNPLPLDLPWIHVAYTEEEHLELVRQSFKDIDAEPEAYSGRIGRAMLNDIGHHYLDRMAYGVKDEAFHDEKEVRLIAPASDVSLAQIKHRPTRFGVTPFVEISRKDESGYHEDDLLPIVQVRVGPTTYPEQAMLALRSILDKNGYRRTKVSSSTAPFR